MKQVIYDAVSNFQFIVFVEDDQEEIAKDILADPGLRGRIGALLNAAGTEVLKRELLRYFPPKEATK